MSLDRWLLSEVADDPIIDKLDWCDYYQQHCDAIADTFRWPISPKRLDKTSFKDILEV